MVHNLRRLACFVILSAAILSLAGCLITDMSGSSSGGVTSIQATATLLQQSPCTVNVAAQTTTCTPTMQVGASPFTQTFHFLITLLGYAAPLTLYDPLIVQVPASMSNFSGTIAAGPAGTAGTPISIISGLTSVPIDASTNLVAEPGMQLVILDFQSPDNAPFGTYTLRFQFSGTTNSVKVVFAAKVTAGSSNTSYYVPIFPCVTSFADVLPITLPLANISGLVQIVASAQGCTAARNYNFTGLGTASGVELNQQGLTGSWFQPSTSGQGFELEVFPNQVAPGTGQVFVSWFTYDTTAGGPDRQRWYTLIGNVVNGQPTSNLTIYQNTGGNFNALPVTTSQAVGTGTLSFTSCTSGQLTYTFTDGSGRTGTIPLTRLLQNETCSTTSARPTNADFGFSGNWFTPATSGQGFTVEVNPNSAAVFAAWYTYAPSGAGAGAAGQRWYTLQNTATYSPGSRSVPVQIYQTTGGAFNATAPAPTTVQVGSGTLAFQSCSSATFTYNFTGGSSSGASGTIALTRVGPVPAGCAF